MTIEDTFRVMDAVSELLSHDIDPDNSYRAEQFLRERHPKFSKRLINQCIADACEQRDRERTHGLFQHLWNQVKAWPGNREIGGEFIEDIIESAAVELHRLNQADPSKQSDDWHTSDPTELKAARYAGLLLIEQTAWRKHENELAACNQQWLDDQEKAATDETPAEPPRMTTAVTGGLTVLRNAVSVVRSRT